ncbi:MAG: hypothetical protein ACE3JK_14550 [Sporolactobacillus sp.]
MADLDFQDRMIDAVESNCALFAPITVPIIKGDEGIGFMMTPVGEETLYMDGSRERTYAFQITARSASEELSLSTLLDIQKYIDTLSLHVTDIVSQNGSFELDSMTVTTVPNVLEFDATKGTIYGSNFEAQLLLK